MSAALADEPDCRCTVQHILRAWDYWCYDALSVQIIFKLENIVTVTVKYLSKTAPLKITMALEKSAHQNTIFLIQ